MPEDVPEDEGEAASSSSKFDVERLAKVLSLVAIPIVVAVLGWMIQNRLGGENIKLEYVKLAVSILQKPSSPDDPSGLRDWATDMLNQNSPVKFNEKTINQLKSGEINLSTLKGLIAATNNGSSVTVSPDGKSVAVATTRNTIEIWDLATGRQVFSLRGNTSLVTSLAYSPDGRSLYAGSQDDTVREWDVATGRELRRLGLDAPVLALAVSNDQKTLVVRTADSHLRVYSTSNFQLLTDIQISSL